MATTPVLFVGARRWVACHRKGPELLWVLRRLTCGSSSIGGPMQHVIGVLSTPHQLHCPPLRVHPRAEPTDSGLALLNGPPGLSGSRPPRYVTLKQPTQ